MESDKPEVKDPVKSLRSRIADNCPMLREDQIMEMMKEYGMDYLPSDSTTLRLCMLLASAERIIQKVE